MWRLIVTKAKTPACARAVEFVSLESDMPHHQFSNHVTADDLVAVFDAWLAENRHAWPEMPFAAGDGQAFSPPTF